MRSTRTRFESLAAAAVACAGLAVAAPLGCREGLAPPIPAAGAPDTPPRRGGTLHLASFEDIRGLDPAGPTDGLAMQAQHLLFAGLVDYDQKGQLVPELADHWEVEDGGRTYRFVLREGVRMHDGEELTAGDVERSAERALHPTTPNPNASYFANLAGYDAYVSKRADRLSGVVVEGRYVVSFHLTDPDATFLPVLAMHTLRPVCKTAGDRYSDTWIPCGAGPFMLAAGGWQRGTSLRLVRHDGYFRPGRPYLDAVEWTFHVQFAAQRFRFEDGDLDLLGDMTQGDEARFSADPRWRSLGTAGGERSVLGESMNTRMPPFDNVEVRRAVSAAIDREHYRALKPLNMTVLTQLVPPGAPGYDPAVEGQRHDDAAALEHMRKAGYPYDPVTGKGGWPAPIVYPLYDQGLLAYTSQLLQQDLAKIGLRLELELVSWPVFLALQQRPGGAAMSQANWEMDYPDPSSLFDPLFTTPSTGAESSYNTSFYSNPRFDDLVGRARRETDPRARRALYREADEILCDESPWAFAYAYHTYDVRQPYVRGFAPHPVWPKDVSRVWLDRAARALDRALGSVLR
jgi:ABC-type transport system substrate-binding protein